MRLTCAALGLALVMACSGGGGGSSAPPQNPPGISNLQFQTPMTIVAGSTGGASTVQMTCDFVAPGGDLASGYLDGLDSAGNVTATLPIPLVGVSGLVTGTLQFTFTVQNTSVGAHPFRIYLKDSRGQASNKLNGTLTIVSSPALSLDEETHDHPLAKPKVIESETLK